MPHLVTTFATPGFSTWMKDAQEPGAEGDLDIGKWMRVEGYPEYDYMIEKKFFSDTVRPAGLEFVDLWSLRRPMLLNCEITVDYDGAIFYGNGFLVRTSTPGAFNAGHLADLECFDSYYVRRPDNDYLLAHTYPQEITKNNLETGRIMLSFASHVRERFPEEFARLKPTRAPEAPAHRW